MTALDVSTAATAVTEPAAAALRQVTKTWPDGTHALAALDLELRAGELTALVGPSGCGKSTVLRVVAGLDVATSGDVQRSGPPPGCVFQQANLLPWRSVDRNVALFAELDHLPVAARRAAVGKALAMVGLEGFRKHLPHQLSGGMQMRAALARALVTEPDLLLFDEPFAAVDELLRERLQEELSRLFAAQQFAGLFITHSVSEAVFLSTRILVMSARPGRIVAEVEVPFEHPRSLELRFDPQFVEIARTVSLAMRSAAREEDR